MKASGVPAASIDRVGWFLAVMFALCGLAAFPGSALFDLTEVTARGNAAVPTGEVLRRAGIAPGESAFHVNAAGIRERVLRDPRIQDVMVAMAFPHRVTIVVRERPPVAALEMGDRYVLLGADGVAIAQAAVPAPYVLLEVDELERAWVRVGTITPSPDVSLGAQVAGMLPDRLRGMVAAVHVSSVGEVVLRLRDGVSVRLGGAQGLADRLRTVPDILSAVEARGQRVEYVDIRFPGNVVIKPLAQAGSHPAFTAPGTASPGPPALAPRPPYRQENPEGR